MWYARWGGWEGGGAMWVEGVGYAGAEGERARSGEAHRAGVLVWAKKPKTEPWGLGFGRW